MTNDEVMERLRKGLFQIKQINNDPDITASQTISQINSTIGYLRDDMDSTTPSAALASGDKTEQPIISLLVRRAEIMPDGSLGAVYIGEFAGDRAKDLRLTISQAKTIATEIGRIVL